MPRDAGDDVYEEMARELREAEAARLQKLHARKMARRKPKKPSKRCRSCGCEQKRHKRSRGACEADIEVLNMGGPTPSPCWCRAFNP